MQSHWSAGLTALSLSFALAMTSADAGPLNGPADSPKSGGERDYSLRHDVASKRQCTCTKQGRCWIRCCRAGARSWCYRACYGDKACRTSTPLRGASVKPLNVAKGVPTLALGSAFDVGKRHGHVRPWPPPVPAMSRSTSSVASQF